MTRFTSLLLLLALICFTASALELTEGPGPRTRALQMDGLFSIFKKDQFSQIPGKGNGGKNDKDDDDDDDKGGKDDDDDDDGDKGGKKGGKKGDDEERK